MRNLKNIFLAIVSFMCPMRGMERVEHIFSEIDQLLAEERILYKWKKQNCPGTSQEKCALHKACEQNNLAVVKILLARVQVNERNGLGQTALHIAVGEGNTEIVKLLLKHGADIHTRDNNGWSTLLAKCRHKDIERLFSKEADLEWQDKEGKTEMYVSVKSRTKEIVELLVEAGADINSDFK